MANPTVANPVADQSDDENDVVSIDVSGVFDDDDLAATITWSVSGLPVGTGLSIDADTGVLSGSVTQADLDALPFTLTFTADDGNGTTVDVTKDFQATPTEPGGGDVVFPLVWLNGIGFDRATDMPGDSSTQADIWSRYDVAVINWTPAQNTFARRQSDISAIINTEFKTYLLQYINVLRAFRGRARETGNNDDGVDISAALDNGTIIGQGATWTPNDWWGRRNDGTLDSEPGFGENFVNYTEEPEADAQGRKPWRRVAEYYLIEDLSIDSLNLDGLYYDNAQPTLPFSEQNTDFLRSGQGTISRFDSGAVARRSQAVKNCAQYHRQTMIDAGRSDFFITANGVASFENGTIDYSIYDQAVEGGSFEKASGNSVTNQMGIAYDGSDSNASKTWESAYERLLNGQRHHAESPLGVPATVVFFDVYENNFRTARQGLCTALMAGCLIALSSRPTSHPIDSNSGYVDALFIDEFVGQDLSGMTETQIRTNRHYLGAAADPQQTGPWNSGVYKREFENGVAFVNPKGNGAQTVNVSGITKTGFHLEYIAGGQDPVRNPGGDVGSTVSLAGGTGDGLILLWTADP